MCLGSARVSRAGDGVLAIVDFLCNSSFRAADASYETSTRDACAARKCSTNALDTAFVI